MLKRGKGSILMRRPMRLKIFLSSVLRYLAWGARLPDRRPGGGWRINWTDRPSAWQRFPSSQAVRYLDDGPVVRKYPGGNHPQDRATPCMAPGAASGKSNRLPTRIY